MQFNLNLSLVPIGNSYWLTGTKIGSNYIKNYANPNDRYLRLTLNKWDEDGVPYKQIPLILPNGLKFKVTVSDFSDINYTHLYDEKTLLDIFSRVSVVLLRNPKERFISGFVQKISEMYGEIPNAIETNTMNKVRFHDKVYFDLTKYDIDYTLLTTGMAPRPKDDNPNWKPEWEKFSNYILNDVINHPNLDRILLDDRHTQGVYLIFNLILNSLPNWNNIKTLDINDLEECSELLIQDLGKDEYQKRNDALHNREEYNPKIEDLEQINIIKRVSNKRLYFNPSLIESYYEYAPFYVIEKMYYDILVKKQYKKLI
jgi:hypothetical protein